MSTSITIRARIMYPHLHQPHKFNDDEPDKAPMYRATLVMAKDDPAVAQVRAIADKLIKDELDGITVAAEQYLLKEDPDNENVAGCLVIKAKTQYKPNVLENGPTGMVPIMDPAKPADGDWVFANINMFSYNTRGNKGIGASLNGILFAEAGKLQLGKSSAPSAEDMFGNVVAQAAPQTSAAPAGGSNPFGS